MMLIERINAGWDVVLALLSGFWKFLDQSKAVRRALLFWGFWAQLEALHWSYTFAMAAVPNMSGAEKAGVIGAVLGPVSIFFAAVIKLYNDSRMQDKAQEGS